MKFNPFEASDPSILRVTIVLVTLLCSLPRLPLAATTIEIELQSTRYQIELATTPRQRQLGLMHRPGLAPRRGMLLVYPEPGDHRIWMKNVLIPLRVFWIDADFTVISAQRLEPCLVSPCPVYAAEEDSLYVLELGDYPHPLKPGDRIEGLGNL